MGSSGFLAVGAILQVAGIGVGLDAQSSAFRTQASLIQHNARVKARDLEVEALLRDRDAQERDIQIQTEKELLKFDIDTLDREEGRFRSTQDAAIGVSGFEPSGSLVEVQAESAREFAIERQRLAFESGIEQRALRQEADVLEFQARDARTRARLGIETAEFTTRLLRREAVNRFRASLLGGLGQGATSFGLSSG